MEAPEELLLFVIEDCFCLEVFAVICLPLFVPGTFIIGGECLRLHVNNDHDVKPVFAVDAVRPESYGVDAVNFRCVFKKFLYDRDHLLPLGLCHFGCKFCKNAMLHFFTSFIVARIFYTNISAQISKKKIRQKNVYIIVELRMDSML